MFATGIENSYPTVAQADGSTLRVDEMAKTDHYRRWREDFGLVVEMGVAFLRYGPPYSATHLGPDRYDWSLVGAVVIPRSEATRDLVCETHDRLPVSHAGSLAALGMTGCARDDRLRSG